MTNLTKSVEAPRRKLGPHEYEVVRSARWFQISSTSDDFVFFMVISMFVMGVVAGVMFS